MYWRILLRFLIVTSFTFISFNISAETTYPINSSQGIGALGHIEPRSRVISVSHNAGPEGARVKQLFFREADQVNSGEKLAVLSDYDKKNAEVNLAKTRIKVLEAQRHAEQVTLTFNKKEHLRYQSLKQDSMASISLADAKHLAFEQSAENIKRLSAEIINAESERRIAEVALDNTFIYAPLTGTILKILAWPGERIQDSGLLEMADLSQLDVVAEVYKSDLPKVKVGQKAYISGTGFKHTYNAQVRELGFQVKKKYKLHGPISG